MQAIPVLHTSNPIQDVEQRRPYIFWGTSFKALANIEKSRVDAIRAKIIEINFASKEPMVFTLGAFHIQEIKPTFASTVLRTAVKCYIVMLYFIVMIGKLGVIFIIPLALIKCAIKLKNEPELVFFYFGMYLAGLDMTPELNRIYGLFRKVGLMIETYQQRVRKAYADKCATLYAIFQELKTIPSSNHAATEKGINPITQEEMPFNEVRAPKILKIGPYTLEIRDALHSIFERHISCQRMRHPIENRTFENLEAENFLDDVCAFMCISSRKELFGCWQEKLTAADLRPLHQSNKWRSFPPEIQGKVQEAFEKMLLPIRVANKFLKLLPDSTRDVYFKDIGKDERVSIDRFLADLPSLLPLSQEGLSAEFVAFLVSILNPPVILPPRFPFVVPRIELRFPPLLPIQPLRIPRPTTNFQAMQNNLERVASMSRPQLNRPASPSSSSSSSGGSDFEEEARFGQFPNPPQSPPPPSGDSDFEPPPLE